VRRAERLIQRLGGHFRFSCLHLRRARDFVRDRHRGEPLNSTTLLRNVERLLEPGERLYVATEANSSNDGFHAPTAFDFSPLSARYELHMLPDHYFRLRHDTKPSWLGPIEQLVCSRGRVFIGSRSSTFTNYIHRMRGYMADVRQKTYLYHNLRFPDEYQRLQHGPSWTQGSSKVAFGSRVKRGFDFLGEYSELHEDTVTAVFR